MVMMTQETLLVGAFPLQKRKKERKKERREKLGFRKFGKTSREKDALPLIVEGFGLCSGALLCDSTGKRVFIRMFFCSHQ